MASPGKDHMELHYADLKEKKFFPGLIEYMTSGPVVCMVLQGMDAVITGRKMLGATKPADSDPGTIRGDLCLDVGRNICHGSDSVEAAEAEIALWFPEGLCAWDACKMPWIYESSATELAAEKAEDGSGAAAPAPVPISDPRDPAWEGFKAGQKDKDNKDPAWTASEQARKAEKRDPMWESFKHAQEEAQGKDA